MESPRGSVVGTVLKACTGTRLLIACRQVGSATLTLAANAPRTDVLFDTGVGMVTTHNANGVEWYYNTNHSWGFSPGGDKVNLNSCDTYGIGMADPNNHATQRMCWHTSAGSTNSGYRCGSTDLNGNVAWERVIYTAN